MTDRNNMQPGDETFQDAEGDAAPGERYDAPSGGDQEVDPSISRMTTDAPVEPDGTDPG